MSRSLRWRAFLVVAVIGGAIFMVFSKPARLGLDLRGGTQIVLEAESTPKQELDDDTVDRTVEVLRRRVDQLGVSEPTLQRSGARRIIVELPGVSDPKEAVDVIGRTAQLEFRSVLGVQTQGTTETATDEAGVFRDEEGAGLSLGDPALTGDAVKDAMAIIDPQTSGWEVQVEFRRGGSQKWEALTGKAACAPAGDPTRRVAIVLDKDVISSPQVSPEVLCNEGIKGGTTVITGGFTEDEAKDLALLIRAGALPVPVEIVEQRTVGPSLGKAAIEASVVAAIIGASLTMIYMIAYYRLLGAFAALALVAYGLLSFAVLLALGATLTLPGIAGFVLAIGMAVDANVLVFERMREEHEARGRVGSAITDGFRNAWSAIADSNATTFLAALLLFYLASGSVRGFGITLMIGVAVSMFTALVVTRMFAESASRVSVIRNRPGLLGLVGGRFGKRLRDSSINLMKRRGLWFSISLVALALALAGFFARGLNYGVEFTGGRLLEYDTAQPVNLDRARDSLAAAGLPSAVVQHANDSNLVVRTALLSDGQEKTLDDLVTKLGGDTSKIRDEFIGPTIGDELRSKALLALGLALTVQLLYLAFRFRWNYGLAAVTAMFHDVLILIGVFAWLGKDIDGVFLAALLTVIGYSINDSVVVFDRIREQRQLRSSEPFEEVANAACLQTVPRTINTGLGAMFILLALYFLGGETLTDFALALLIGILVGTYSSVFTATPLCVAMDKLSPAPPPTKPSGMRAGRSSARKPTYSRPRPRR